MDWIPFRQLMGAASLLLHLAASGQTPTWQGDTAHWLLTDVTATLNAPAAGSASIRRCLVPLDSVPDGVDLRWRWQQLLAGSSSNRSTLTAYTLAPDSQAVAVLSLGSTGSEDPLVAQYLSGGTLSDAALLPGTFAEELDAEFRWLQHPGGNQATLFIRSAGEPLFTPLLEADGTPTCLSLTAQFTASHVTDFALAIEPDLAFHPDTTPPNILFGMWGEGGAYEVQFSEVLAQLPVGFWGPSTGSLCSFLTPSRLACLPPPEGILPGTPSVLCFLGAADTAGNIAPSLQSRALYLPPNTERPGDVAITEIMADPTPSAGFPETEWLELTNFSSAHLDVRNLTLRDGTQPSPLIPLPPWDGVLAPNDRCVVSADTTRIAPGIRQALAPQGGTLTDAGERLALERVDGLELDVVNYDRSWWQGVGGGHSIALQQRGACSIAAHWKPANPAHPGTGNESPPPPSTPLHVESFEPRSPEHGEITFNQPIAPFAHPTLTWRAPGAPDLPLIPTGDRTVAWHGVALPEAVTEWVISGLPTCDAPWERPTPIFHSDSLHGFPEPGDLTVTEIAVRPPAGWPGLPAFVEWTNTGNTPLEVAGVTLNGEQAPVRILPAGGSVIQPIDLPNLAGDIALVDGTGQVLERFRYSSCWHANRNDEEAGLSLERCDVLGPAADGRNWRTCPSALGCTPGWHETGPAWRDESPPEILAWFIANGEPVAWFSEPVVPVDDPSSIPANVDDLGVGADWGRAWRPSLTGSTGTVQDLSGNASAVIWSVPELGSGTWRLNECRAWVSSAEETFLETFAEGADWVSSANWLLSNVELPGPADWSEVAPVEWWVPGNREVGWSRCPQRLGETGLVLPSELPSLHGDRLISLAEWREPHRELVDTIWSARDRFDPHDRLSEGTSWERFHPSAGAWAPSPAGHTAGRENALSHHVPEAQSPLHASPKTCIPMHRDWGQIALTWSSDQPLERLEVWSASGLRLRTLPARTPGGALATWFWDGTGDDGLPAAPGPYWVVAVGGAGETTLARQIISVAPPSD